MKKSYLVLLLLSVLSFVAIAMERPFSLSGMGCKEKAIEYAQHSLDGQPIVSFLIGKILHNYHDRPSIDIQDCSRIPNNEYVKPKLEQNFLITGVPLELKTENNVFQLGKTYAAEYCYSFSANEQKLALYVDNSWLKIFDVQTGKVTNEIKECEAIQQYLAFNNDNSLIATISANGLVKIWDLATEYCIYEFETNIHYVPCMTFDFDQDNQVISLYYRESSGKIIKKQFFIPNLFALYTVIKQLSDTQKVLLRVIQETMKQTTTYDPLVLTAKQKEVYHSLPHQFKELLDMWVIN